MLFQCCWVFCIFLYQRLQIGFLETVALWTKINCKIHALFVKNSFLCKRIYFKFIEFELLVLLWLNKIVVKLSSWWKYLCWTLWRKWKIFGTWIMALISFKKSQFLIKINKIHGVLVVPKFGPGTGWTYVVFGHFKTFRTTRNFRIFCCSVCSTCSRYLTNLVGTSVFVWWL